MEKLLNICIINIVAFGPVFTQTLTNAKNLHTFLFTDYNKNIKPVLDQNSKVDVSIDLYLLAINDFDAVEGTLSLVGALNCSWTDVSLTWTPSSYSDLSSISISQSDIWIPEIFLINEAEKFIPFGNSLNVKASVSQTGGVVWNPGDVMNIKCSPNMLHFPFDTQSCAIMFIAFGQAFSEISLVPSSIYANYLTVNKGWNLESTSLEEETSGRVLFRLNLKRASGYFIVTVLTPIYILDLICPLIFLLPVESGERVSFSTSVVLSYAVFLTLVNAEMPSLSDPVPIIMTYIDVMIGIGGLIVVINVIILYYFFSDGEEVESACLKRFLCMFGRSRKVNDTETLENVNTKVDKELAHKMTKRDAVKRLNIICFVGSYILIIIFSVLFTLSTIVNL